MDAMTFIRFYYAWTAFFMIVIWVTLMRYAYKRLGWKLFFKRVSFWRSILYCWLYSCVWPIHIVDGFTGKMNPLTALLAERNLLKNDADREVR